MLNTQFKQCGKVLICSDHRLIVWECVYCNAIHTDCEGFLEHVKTLHQEESQYEKLQINENLKTEECNKDDRLMDSNKIEIHLKTEEFIMNDQILDFNRSDTLMGLNVKPNYKPDEQTMELSEENRDYGTTESNETLSLETLSESNICRFDSLLKVEHVDSGEEPMESRVNSEDPLNLPAEFNALEEKVTTDNIQTDGFKESSFIEIEKDTKNSNARHENFKIESTQKQNRLRFFELASESEILSFIENIKQHPCLWNTKLNVNISEQKRIKSIRKMQNLLQISPIDIIQKLNYLITWFKAEYNRFKNCRINKTTFTSRYPKYFVKCKFLISNSTEDLTLIHRKKSTTISNDFKCSHCEKVFSKKQYLTVHIRRHTKDFSYKCNLCGQRTLNSSDLKAHMRVHTGEKPYVCEKCGKSFKTSSALNGHIRTHDIPKFQCHLCAKSYFSRTDLRNHTNAHLNKRDYKCEFCTKAFTSPRLLYSHIQKLHSTLRKTFCNICKKCFKNIEYHKKSVHEVDVK